MRKIIDVYKFKVEGIKGDECVEKIKAAIKTLEEVDSFEVCKETGEITINIWVPLPMAIAFKTVESLGYKIV